jgi:glycosyltransferase involved in cell wall biosynthesis
MRILEITYSYKPIRGGADVYAEDLRRVLEAAGHEVRVLQKPPAPADDPHVLAYPSPFGALNAFWGLPLSLPFMMCALRRQDALICHYPNYALPALWHPRVIGLSHGVTWDDRPSALQSRVKRSWARWAFRRCAKFVANDTFFLREVGVDVAPGAPAFSEVQPGRWFMPNAVDTDFFRPGPPGDEAARYRPFLLAPRNIYWNRGVHLAVEALARLGPERQDLRLVVVGDEGQPEAVAAAREAVTRHHLEDRVVFAGPRPRADLLGWYRAAEVTVIPSLCGEGTSLSALESMACGTPVVGTDIGGMPDLPCVHARPEAEDFAAALERTLAGRAAEAARQMEAVHRDFNFGRWADTWRHVVEDW